MPSKTFNFASFEPMLWDSDLPHDTTAPVLDVNQLAPAGSPRSVLRTKVFSRQNSPHDAFNAFNGRHDVVKRFQAYAPPGSDGEESDALQEQIYVQPLEFHAYQLRNQPTHLYLTAPDLTVNSMFRRYRETHKDYSVTLSRRIVDIDDLEKRIPEMEIVGYTLKNVRSVTPITSMDVLGVQMDQNTEVQDAKGRAGNIAAITFDLQNDHQIIRVRVARNGAVRFVNFPGDAPGLSLLEKLEIYIANSASLESIQVRNSRSG